MVAKVPFCRIFWKLGHINLMPFYNIKANFVSIYFQNLIFVYRKKNLFLLKKRKKSNMKSTYVFKQVHLQKKLLTLGIIFLGVFALRIKKSLLIFFKLPSFHDSLPNKHSNVFPLFCCCFTSGIPGTLTTHR